jgi:hypothetical protein
MAQDEQIEKIEDRHVKSDKNVEHQSINGLMLPLALKILSLI